MLAGLTSLKGYEKSYFGVPLGRSNAPLSKRAQSTTLTSLRLESSTYGLVIDAKVICALIVP